MSYYLQPQEYFGMPVMPYFEPRYMSKRQQALDNIEKDFGTDFKNRCKVLAKAKRHPHFDQIVYQAFCDLLAEHRDKTPTSKRASTRTNS